MPLALVLAGIVLIATAFRGTYGMTQSTGQPGLAGLIVGDVTGSGSFLVWIGALAIIGMIGYIPKMETPSRAMLALILLALFISNNGFFTQFASALQGASAQPAPTNQEPRFQGALPITFQGATGSGTGVAGSAASNPITSAMGSFLP